MGCESCAASGGWLGEGLNRRDFVARSTVTAIAALLAACGDGQIGPSLLTGPVNIPGGSYTFGVSNYPSLAQVGGIARVSVPGGGVLGVGRVGASSFAAYGLACTHQGTTVRPSGNIWYCPSHGAEFSVSGSVVRGPASRPLVSVPITYDPVADSLTIEGSTPPATTGGGGDDDREGDD